MRSKTSSKIRMDIAVLDPVSSEAGNVCSPVMPLMSCHVAVLPERPRLMSIAGVPHRRSVRSQEEE